MHPLINPQLLTGSLQRRRIRESSTRFNDFCARPGALGRLPFFISLCGNPARARRRPSLRERPGEPGCSQPAATATMAMTTIRYRLTMLVRYILLYVSSSLIQLSSTLYVCLDPTHHRNHHVASGRVVSTAQRTFILAGLNSSHLFLVSLSFPLASRPFAPASRFGFTRAWPVCVYPSAG